MYLTRTVVVTFFIYVVCASENFEDNRWNRQERGKERGKRNVYQFAKLIKCAAKSTCLDSIPVLHGVSAAIEALDYNGYGCYCGIGPGRNSGIPPLDGLDNCCKIHDECYGDVLDMCPWYNNPYSVTYDWSDAECHKGKITCTDTSEKTKCDRKSCECDKEAALCFARHLYNEDYSPSQMKEKKDQLCLKEPEVKKEPQYNCSVHGNMLSLLVSGASTETAKQDGLHTSGTSASLKMITTDFKALLNYKSCFYRVGRKEGIHPALIAGIASRVSRAGKLLKSDGMSKLPNSEDTYGLMQCNMKTSGLKCKTYKPFSCEHIEMMVTEALIPYIKQMRKKFPKWTSERHLQGAVAAYNFGVHNVLTWRNLDKGTTGNDFSNDVIARAQALVYDFQWNCNDLPKAVHPIQPVTGRKDCKYLLENQKCSFYYHCIDEKLLKHDDTCKTNSFHMDFLYRQCIHLNGQKKDFTEEGKEWLDESIKCMMTTMYNHVHDPSMNCAKLKDVGLRTMSSCYHDSGVGFCNILYENKVDLFQASMCDFFGEGKEEVRGQMLKILDQCNLASLSCEFITDVALKVISGQAATKLLRFLKKKYPQLETKNKFIDFISGIALGIPLNKYIFDPIGSFLRKQCRGFFKHYKQRGRRSLQNHFNTILEQWKHDFRSHHVDLIVKSNKASNSKCITYAQDGDCRFYECFEERFPCSKYFRYHILHFELPYCHNMERQSNHDASVNSWHKSYQKCLMGNLLKLYTKPETDCNDIEEVISSNRTKCMVDSGWCNFGPTQLWYIDRGVNSFGFSAFQSSQYMTLPISESYIRLEDYYFSYLQSIKGQLGDANHGCFVKGERALPVLYQHNSGNANSKVVLMEQ